MSEKKKEYPSNNYGLFHKFTEDLIQQHKIRRNLKTNLIFLRISNVVGMPLVKSKSVYRLLPHDVCRSLIKKNAAYLKSSGKQYRNFICINDLLNAISKLSKKNIPSGIYNIGGKNISVINFVKLIKKSYDKKFKKNAKILVKSNFPKEIDKLNYNFDKISKELKYYPKNSFQNSINSILNNIS